MSQTRTPPTLLTLILLAGLSTLALNMFVPSLPAIAREFEVDYAWASLAMSGYLVSVVVVQLAVAPLSDRFGRRPVILVGLTIFALASAICAVAPNIWVFLAARAVQSAMTVGYAVSLAVVRDMAPPEKTAATIGTISGVMALAPILGPLLGGWLDLWFGWRASFWAYTLAAIALLGWSWRDLGETRKEAPQATASGAFGVLVRDPLFRAYALCTAFATSAFYAFLAGVPVLADTRFALSADRIGLILGSITIGYMIGNFIAARLAPGRPLSHLILAGRFASLAGPLMGFAVLALGLATPGLFFSSLVFVGLGNGLTTPGSNSGALSTRAELAGTAAGLSGALTVAIGAAFTLLAGLVTAGPMAAQALLSVMLLAILLSLWAGWRAHRLSAAPAAAPLP